MIGVNYDITDQKIAENLLREREFWLSESQKIRKIGSYVFDITNMIWSSSEVLDEIFGIDESYKRTLEGWNDLVHPEEKEEMLNYVKDYVIIKKNFFDKEYRIVNHKTGQVQWMYGRGALSFGDNGKPVKMIGTIQDITRRKSVEIQLERSFSLLKATIESTADGLLVVDKDGKIVTYNQKFADMWGIPEEVLDTKDDNLALKFVIGQLKYPDVFIETVKYLYKSPKKISFDILEFNDGKIFERYSQPQKINEKIVGRVWSFRDVTQTKNAEKQLINAKEKAEESDRLKTAFLHNISHEIRTPMNAIVGFTALLDDPEIDKDTQKNFINIIRDSTNQLLSLISDIVDISNIETGQVNLSYSAVNLNSIIIDLYEKFSTVALMQNLIFSYDAEIPDEKAIIHTDREKLIQILSHLLSNAFKFTKRGSVRIGYRVTGINLELFIKDTGIGIPNDKQARIFDRFYQIENDSSREFNGAGLGLSICQAYAELLGGNIGVRSAPGEGSEFYFTHPL